MIFIYEIAFLLLVSCTSSKISAPHTCKEQSKELSQLVKADQNDRKDFQSQTVEQLKEMSKRDGLRIIRVGEISKAGCLINAQDYSSAALIYQHGDSPEDFYQAYLWSKKAVELGDENQKQMMAMGIDRYLVSLGKKQLFGSQATKENSCWCLHQVESSFPEAKRIEQT
jgi:hypothetical protein